MSQDKEIPSIGSGIFSMTGFGREELKAPGLRISVEIRSVNSRFCEIGMKIPRELNAVEADIRDHLRSRITRGKISLLIALERDSANDEALKIDFQMANNCYQTLQELNQSLGNPGPVTLGQLLHFSDFFTQETERTLDETLKKQALAALDGALADLVQMRRSEGVVLAQDLLQRLSHIESTLGEIEKLAADQPMMQLERLRERLELLVAPGLVEPGRLELEMAILADRLDITEECVRLRSHCQHYREALGGAEPAGKLLGFLLQEMNREVNTISSKAAIPEISHFCVNLKEEIERMREQIQNLE